jgi:hypothetical protein
MTFSPVVRYKLPHPNPPLTKGRGLDFLISPKERGLDFLISPKERGLDFLISPKERGLDSLISPLSKQGIFILGGKKEKKSDLLLIKLQKYHYFLSFKIC